MHHRVAIIGTGFSGLGAAIRLKQAGVEDFVLLERAPDVGGTWQANTYPGCACDVPSHLYSFSFALNPEWSSTFSPQPEIHEYLRDTARRHAILDHVRLGVDVTRLSWDDDEQLWRLETSEGLRTANVVVSGSGGLSEPAVPRIPGLADFPGAVWHSATWNHDVDLRGKRVAVVGTGASAIQFVPEIQPLVKELHLFQRTPAWIVPRRARPITRLERALYRCVPPAQRAMRGAIYWARETFVLQFRNPRVGRMIERLALTHLRKQVRGDRDLLRKLTPSYRMGCKRILISNNFYPAVTKPNVDVIASGLTEIRGSTAVAADGTEREVDVIIFGTGFHVADQPMQWLVHGREGVSLGERWNGSMHAYNGCAITGFPNFFLLLGPHTGLGHNSVVFMIESQIDYVLRALQAMERSGAREIEVKGEAMEAFRADVDRDTQGTVWVSPGCNSYYLDATGRNSALWPRTSWSFRRRVARFDPADHDLLPARVTEPEPALA